MEEKFRIDKEYTIPFNILYVLIVKLKTSSSDMSS